VATGALFLATKVEECPRRARDVLNCFCHLSDKRAGKAPAPVDIYATAFVNLKDKLIRAEREILKELGFILYSEHPHKFILNYVKLLSPTKDKEPALAQAAWNFINDSQRTNVCIRFAPEVICCAAIWFAARALGLKLPSHTEPPWWELFDAKKADMDAVVATVIDLYTRPRANFIKLDPPPEPLKPVAPPPAAKPAVASVVAGDAALSAPDAAAPPGDDATPMETETAAANGGEGGADAAGVGDKGSAREKRVRDEADGAAPSSSRSGDGEESERREGGCEGERGEKEGGRESEREEDRRRSRDGEDAAAKDKRRQRFGMPEHERRDERRDDERRDERRGGYDREYGAYDRRDRRDDRRIDERRFDRRDDRRRR